MKYDELPEVFGPKTLARFLGIGENVAYQLVNRGDFPSFRVGRLIKVTKAALKQWLDEQVGVKNAG